MRQNSAYLGGIFVTSVTYPGEVVVTNRTYPGEVVAISSGCVELPAASLLPYDHADSLVSRATRKVVEDVVYVGMMPLLTVIGVLANALNMAVFVAQGLKDRVNFCLFSLSLADLLALTSLSVRFMNKTLADAISPSWVYDVWLTSLVRYRLVAVHAGFQMVSNFISIIIAVDRCVCVSWPLRAAHLLSVRGTGVVIAIFSILVLAGIQFVAFKYDVGCTVLKDLNAQPFLYILPSKLYKDNPILMEIFDSFVFSSLVPTLSLVVTAIATTITAIKLRRAALWRDRTVGGGRTDIINQREKALTYMLVVISCIYIVCVSPHVVRSLCQFFLPEFRVWGRWRNLVVLTEAVRNALQSLNSVLNFFIYCLMGSRFRSTLRDLVTRCRPWSSDRERSNVTMQLTMSETKFP